MIIPKAAERNPTPQAAVEAAARKVAALITEPGIDPKTKMLEATVIATIALQAAAPFMQENKMQDMETMRWNNRQAEIEKAFADGIEAAAKVAIPVIERLITDYGDVPDATDENGQAVFEDARAAIAKIRTLKPEVKE